MKRKFSIGLLMLTLIMTLGATALTACSNDDDPDSGVYEGYIEDIYHPYKKPNLDYDYFIIVVSHAPKDKFKGIKKKARLLVDLKEFPEIDFKANQSISFRITSAQIHDPNEFVHAFGVWESYDWKCKIEILNLN